MVGVRQAAHHTADRLTRFVIVKANALGTQFRIDDVDLVTLANRLVGALGLAGSAIDAVGRDVRGHGRRECNVEDGRAMSNLRELAASLHSRSEHVTARHTHGGRRRSFFSRVAHSGGGEARPLDSRVVVWGPDPTPGLSFASPPPPPVLPLGPPPPPPPSP